MLFFLYVSMFSPVQHYNESSPLETERDRDKAVQRDKEIVIVFLLSISDI